jgi:hypothetical protein
MTKMLPPEIERAHAEAAALYRKALNRDPNFLSGYESQEYWDAVAAELEALSEQNGIPVGLTLFDDIGAEALARQAPTPDPMSQRDPISVATIEAVCEQERGRQA